MPQQGYKEHEGFAAGDCYRFTTGLFTLFVFSMATPFQVVLHHSHGAKFLRAGPILVSLMLTAFWTGMWPEHDPRPMFAAYYVVMGMTVLRGLQCARRLSRPIPGVHSTYNGTPYLLTRWFGEDVAKNKVEPALLALAGLSALSWSEPLGWFLVVGGGCLTTETAMAIDAQRARNRAISDARIEAGLLRDRRWG